MRTSRAVRVSEGGWHSPPAAATDRSLRAGILRQARSAPGQIALRLVGRDIVYAELVDTARRWAGRLIDLAAGRPTRVGVFAYRTETAYAGVLASLFAGAAFVPLNRRFPSERTLDMIVQAELDAGTRFGFLPRPFSANELIER